MLPSTYQIRTGIRKAPWLVIERVTDGGTWWWKSLQVRALSCAVPPPAATFPYSIAESCPQGGTTLPNIDGYQRPRVAGRAMAWVCLLEPDPERALRKAIFIFSFKDEADLARGLELVWAWASWSNTKVLKWIINPLASPEVCSTSARWLFHLDCGDGAIPCCQAQDACRARRETLPLQATAFNTSWSYRGGADGF